MDPRLQGYRMQAGQYAPIEADDEGFLCSHELELRLKIEHGELQFYRRDTGGRLLTAPEQRDQIAQALEVEAAAWRAEADVERLREELRKRQP